MIYTERTSERLSYIFDFILGELLGLEFITTNDKEVFLSFTGPKFSYASKPVAGELFFASASVLFENDLTLQPVDFIDYENMVGFYPVEAPSAMPFDMFASSFVMITRYNEYLIHKKDKYDRYRPSQSMNAVAGFLGKPMINYYALHLKNILSKTYQALRFKENRFEYLVTVDVDTAYEYLGQGLKANAGGFVGSLLTSNFRQLKERYKVVFRKAKDPFDTFDEILDICKKYDIKTRFFFLIGNRSSLDRNIPHTFEPYRETIARVARQTDIGVHLSFMSHISLEAMETEIERLQHLSGSKISANRFNYLRFTLPASYVSLNRIGITEDYSMGYATRVGFRAGTCTPFYFFNLQKNERTNLKIYPFAFMDTTLARYNKLGARHSLDKILQIMKWVKEVEGPFIGVWHNNSFTETGIWTGWKNIFETVAKEAAALTEKSE